jgi:UDP-N-acetylmuramyl pentapeptide phosphotransferase/UDP-N-acetylglucosamine-1-phosphate transferase
VPDASAPWLWTGSALALSALATWASILYARSRRLIDEPGARRSHTVPTPRGGGIGLVVAILVCGLLPGWNFFPWVLVPAVLVIALVGWIDDHRGLSARWRFAVHCVVALWTFTLPIMALGFRDENAFSWTLVSAGTLAAGVLAAFAAVWSINLHNFMDGINGLLAFQAMFVFGVVAGLMRLAEPAVLPVQQIVWIAAIAGFVPFNFPRARVFMGDVGSGVLGLLVAAAIGMLLMFPRVALASGIVACSAFVTDATCTLVSRIVRGRRWYSAHREHLYQWLVRCGNSHARVVAYYMGWNLLIVLPVVGWMNRSIASDAGAAGAGFGAAVFVYALAAGAWLAGKRHCIAIVRARRRHGAA